MPQIEVYDLRLSLIWVDTVLTFLGDPSPQGAPLAFLGRRSSYGERFEQMLERGTIAGDYQPPWPVRAGHFFWTYYLESYVPGYISGDQAWKALVPFRWKLPATVQTPSLPGRLSHEAFFYPHGIAIIVTAVLRANLSLEEAVEKAFEVKKTGRFEVKWDDEAAPESVSLEVFARKALPALHKTAFGPETSYPVRSISPFTVATVVKGSGVEPNNPVSEGGKIHRALEAMTTWQPTWREDVLPSLAESSLKIRTAPASHSLYGRKRGRVVWFPGLFVRKTPGSSSLACYHRNLVFASLQVESLSAFILETWKQICDTTKLTVTHEECARRAASILGRLYGGNASTYRSWSPRAHIEQNDLVTAINDVRDLFDMPPLS